MPFILAIESAENLDNNKLKIAGKISSGAFFGSEAIELFTKEGESISGVIESHALLYPIFHPVTSEHTQTKVIITICTSKEISIYELSNLINENRIDISDRLKNPLFWGCHLYDLFLDEAGEYLFQQVLRVSKGEVNNYYLDVFDRNYRDGNWLFINLKLDEDRSIEIEYACGIEYQTRYWICYKNRKVILGYESGHFSLPGIRLSEIITIASKLEGQQLSHLSLLLLPCCYINENDSLNDLRNLFSPISKKQGEVNILVDNLQNILHARDLIWQEDAKLGWINNGKYSQKNPNSLMSIINESEYLTSQEFFT